MKLYMKYYVLHRLKHWLYIYFSRKSRGFAAKKYYIHAGVDNSSFQPEDTNGVNSTLHYN